MPVKPRSPDRRKIGEYLSLEKGGVEEALELQKALGDIRNPRTRRAWRNKVAEREAPTWWNPQSLWDEGIEDAISRIELWPTRRRVRRFRY